VLFTLATLAILSYATYKILVPSKQTKEAELKYILITAYHSIDPSVGKLLGVQSLQDVMDVMTQIEYRKDTVDDIKSPELTLKRGYGDCKDLSVLSASLLAYIGIEPSMMIMYNDTPIAHIVTFFYCDRKNAYYVFDNNAVLTTDSIEEYVVESKYTDYMYIGECPTCLSESSQQIIGIYQ
jgi:hypothetical protein